jgi:TorA maturation chaperone TorD
MRSKHPSLDTLFALWLREPEDKWIHRAHAELGLPLAAPQELAVAYSDLFLLNVYPYAGIFLEANGELNGTRAQEMAALYEQYAYAPNELNAVGAADHIGLMLGFADAVGQATVLPYLMDWAPVLCLAVERAPTAHPFYQALAARTREFLLQQNRKLGAGDSGDVSFAFPLSNLEFLFADEEEWSTRAVVRYLLAPARSGIFLTRARLGLWTRALGAPVAFGDRVQLGTALLENAGGRNQIETVLDWLRAEVDAWDTAYAAWEQEYRWKYAVRWRERTQNTLRLLEELRRLWREYSFST